MYKCLWLALSFALVIDVRVHSQDTEEKPRPVESRPAASVDAPIPESPRKPEVNEASSSADASPNSPAMRIIIEATPDLERSEALKEAVEGLVRDGIAKVVPMNDESLDRAKGYYALISAKSEVSSGSVQHVIKTLSDRGMQRVSFGLANPNSTSDIVVTCRADVPWDKVYELSEALDDTWPVQFRRQPRKVAELQESANEQKELEVSEVSVHVERTDGPATIGRDRTLSRPTKLPANELSSTDSDHDRIYSLRLKYARAKDVARIVEQLLGRPGRQLFSVAVNERANAILVRGDTALIREVTELLSLIDIPEDPSEKPTTDSPAPR